MPGIRVSTRHIEPLAPQNATSPSGTDNGTLVDTPSITVAVSSTDSATATDAPSFAISASNTFTMTEAGSVDGSGGTPSSLDTFTATDTVSTLTVTLSDSNTFTLSESPEEVVISSSLALSSTDTFTMTEYGTNASGGVGTGIIGVAIAFGNTALDEAPIWTRIDDPAGVY